jgi:hypothetical protein
VQIQIKVSVKGGWFIPQTQYKHVPLLPTHALHSLCLSPIVLLLMLSIYTAAPSAVAAAAATAASTAVAAAAATAASTAVAPLFENGTILLLVLLLFPLSCRRSP